MSTNSLLTLEGGYSPYGKHQLVSRSFRCSALQGKLNKAVLDLSETQQTVRLLCKHGAAVHPSTAAACEKLAVAQTKGVNFTASVRHLLEVR